MATRWLRRLPKAELHVHLDGSLRLATFLELARRLSPEERFPSGLDLARAVIPPSRVSLEAYLASFDHTVRVLQSAENLERAAYELCEDAAKENVIYIEIRFAPLLHTAGGLSPREVVQAALAGCERAKEALGIEAFLLLSALRDRSTEQSMQVAQLAAQFRGKGVVGFDLAGPEQGFPLTAHRAAIDLAHDAGVPVTLHAGEGCCPEHIKEALDLGAARIGHAVYLFKAPAIEQRVADLQIPLEVCPTSNLQISGLMTRYADHPLKRYLDLGIPITLNTDNRLMSQIDLTHEYAAVARAFSLKRDELRRIALAGIEAAFAPDAIKETLRSRVNGALAASPDRAS
jgi:adenosine deaminase